MLDIIDAIEARLTAGETTFELPLDASRPLRAWVDLAERLRLRVRVAGDRLVFEKLGDVLKTAGDYRADSPFARINKLEDPRFVLDLREALQRVAAAARPETMRVLDLGCHTGDEIALLQRYLPGASIVAIDRDASALAVAQGRFPDVRFVEADVTALPDLGRFDLVVAIGLLQSGALDDREILRRLVQEQLAPAGAVILGVPNCRYIDGEIEYGARMKNFTQPELGLVIKDVAFYRKYLQQHHKQVFVTGKHYLFVTAVAT